MNSKISKQILGTIFSVFLGMAAIEGFKKAVKSDQLQDMTTLFTPYNIWMVYAFLIMMLAIFTMVRTGTSFLKSKREYKGIYYFLTSCLAYVHYASAAALVVLFLMVLFGKYWFVGFFGLIIILIVFYVRPILTSIVAK